MASKSARTNTCARAVVTFPRVFPVQRCCFLISSLPLLGVSLSNVPQGWCVLSRNFLVPWKAAEPDARTRRHVALGQADRRAMGETLAGPSSLSSCPTTSHRGCRVRFGVEACTCTHVPSTCPRHTISRFTTCGHSSLPTCSCALGLILGFGVFGTPPPQQVRCSA